MKIFRFFLLIAPLFISFLSSGQDEAFVWVSGRIYEHTEFGRDSLTSVQNINVINLRTFQGTVSDRYGFFTLKVTKGDTIIFSSISHVKDTFITQVDEDNEELFIKVVLLPANYLLNGISFYGKDYAGFKHDFVHMKLDTVPNVVPQIDLPQGAVNVPTSFGVTFYGPLTALWEKFSKRGKEMQKLAYLLEKDKKQAFIDSAYKRRVVLNFLQLSEKEVDEFVKFCGLSDEFVRRSSDYDFLSALDICMRGYLEDKKRKR